MKHASSRQKVKLTGLDQRVFWEGLSIVTSPGRQVWVGIRLDVSDVFSAMMGFRLSDATYWMM
jgi:hypothetical protein